MNKIVKFYIPLLVAFILITVVFFYTRNRPVEVIKHKNYHSIILDYRTDISPRSMGHELGIEIKKAIPEIETIYDSFLYESIKGTPDIKQTYDILIKTSQKLSQLIPEPYKEELEGISSQLSGGTTNVIKDGRLSHDELFLINLLIDIQGAENPSTIRTCNSNRCDAFSVFGSTSETGSTIVARILDWEGAFEQCRLHAVTTYRYKNKTVTTVGFALFQGALSGLSSDGIFTSILFSHTGVIFPYKNIHLLAFDMRHVLETYSDIKSASEYTISSEHDYMMNSLLVFSDKHETIIAENDFSQNKENTARRSIRRWNSELNPGVSWNYSNAIASVNAFILKGNYDNCTTMQWNSSRWDSFTGEMKLKLNDPVSTGKISYNEVKEIITYFKVKYPDNFCFGDIYNSNTKQIILYRPESDKLEIFFCPTLDQLPDGHLPVKPEFDSVEIIH